MNKIIALVALLALSGCNYSEGERSGEVVKISRKGVVFKTWEGELATLSKRVGNGQGTALNNVFSFSVKDPEVLAKVKEAMRSSSAVSLVYEEEFFVWPWEAETTYVVTEISVLKQ